MVTWENGLRHCLSHLAILSRPSDRRESIAIEETDYVISSWHDTRLHSHFHYRLPLRFSPVLLPAFLFIELRLSEELRLFVRFFLLSFRNLLMDHTRSAESDMLGNFSNCSLTFSPSFLSRSLDLSIHSFVYFRVSMFHQRTWNRGPSIARRPLTAIRIIKRVLLFFHRMFLYRLSNLFHSQ